MSTTYFFSAFGTFGNPNGFRQSYFLGGNADVVRHIKTFDLKTDAIKLFPGTKIYGIRKEPAGSSSLISYAIYTFAKEQNSQRGGTFIGASLIFVDKIASESLIINVLDEFHQHLEAHNVSEGVIVTNHSDKFSVDLPKDYDKISLNMRELGDLGPAQMSNNYLMVYSETHSSQLQQHFSKAVDLLNSYEMIYFTESHEVAEFVKQKGIFKIVDMNGFDREIQKCHEEKSKALTSYIRDLELEKETLKEDRKQLLDHLEKQIIQNEKRHQENEKNIRESKEGITAINTEFDQYSGRINELIGILKSNGKVENIKKEHLESRKKFADKIRLNRDIGTFSAMGSSSSQRSVKQPLGNSLEDFGRGESRENRGSKLNGYKIAFWSLLLLLAISAVGYIMFLDGGKMIGFPMEENRVAVESGNTDTVAAENKDLETAVEPSSVNLNPFPNAELNENDWRLVSKKAAPETKIDSLISIIYKENPSTVNDYYKHQKKDYKNHLYSLNDKSFEIRGSDTILRDTLKRIPNYIKPGSIH
ncbi:hypothetical protein [Chryseobacterium herbae]|uniref:Uncharacterized protein n=1 Tax=Chryseobacterium herbae TaxID=2976476 RepID=A0ABT2ITE4_9FLAO|nr:hypothetical protein [Chryseobacterium sp. pc1-10]MCT2561987.1 hypothetical protein [Chryseobacterium sp. pc1-10]